MATTIAEAMIELRSDGRRFGAEAKVQIKEQTRGLDAKIQLKPDSKGFRSEAKAETEAETRGLSATVKIKADVDKSQVQKAAADAAGVFQSAMDRLGSGGFSGKGTLLALSPALIPVAGQLAGAMGAVTASFGAAAIGAAGFGLLAASVLTSASQDAQKLSALNLKLNAATTKSAKAAVRAQISALQQGWTPAYRQVMTNLDTLQTRWKSVALTIAAPAVATWLGVVTKGLRFLVPLLTPVADLFQAWGVSLDRYFSSNKGSTEIRAIASAVGQFAAIQLADIVDFFKGMITGVVNLGRDLGANHVAYGAFGAVLVKWGDGFVTWSKSKAARDDVRGFLRYVRQEGPVINGILKDLGKFLPGIFAGATTVGTLELQAISSFMGFVAGLPKSWQQPLVELAGAMLLLSKTGVVSVGVKLVGALARTATGGAASTGLLGKILPGAVIRGGVALLVVDVAFHAIAAVLPKASTSAQQQQKAQTPVPAQHILNILFGSSWTSVTADLQKFVQAPVRRFFKDLGATIVGDWTTALGAITRDNSAAWKAVSDAAKVAWNVVIHPVFNAIRDVAKTIWKAVSDLAGVAWTLIKRGVRTVWTVISTVFGDIINGAAKAFGWIPGIGPKLKTAANAFNKFRDWVNAAINGINGKTVNVGVKFNSGGEGPGGKGIGSHIFNRARGGAVWGAGTATSDSIMARLSDGEYVQTAAAHSYYGTAGMDAIRSRRVPKELLTGYAGGGSVSSRPGHAGEPVVHPQLPTAAQINGVIGKTVYEMAKRWAATMGGSGGAIVADAMRYLGRIPYVWGGTAVPGGADCSGFVQTIYGRHGISAPRTSEAQGSWVRRTGPVPGGLAFYHSPAGGPDPGHVAIIGNGGKVISQGGGMGPQLEALHFLPLLATGIPPRGFGTGRGGGASGGTFGENQLDELWISAGGPGGTRARIAAAIAMAESGGRAGARGPLVPGVGRAEGLWQILGLPFPGNPFDPLTNARMAVSKYHAADGFSPWVTYEDGAYRRFLAEGGPVARSYDSGGWMPPGLSLSYNGTGKPERVGGQGGNTIALTASGDVTIGSPTDANLVAQRVDWAITRASF